MSIQLTEREAAAFFAQINRTMPADPEVVSRVGLAAVETALLSMEMSVTPTAFGEWMARHKMSDVEAADALGCHRNTIRSYREGRVVIPKYIGLACSAYSHGLPAMGS